MRVSIKAASERGCYGPVSNPIIQEAICRLARRHYRWRQLKTPFSLEQCVVKQRFSIFSDSLTPWSIVLLEKLIFPQLLRKFSAFYGIQMFSTAFIKAHFQVRVITCWFLCVPQKVKRKCLMCSCLPVCLWPCISVETAGQVSFNSNLETSTKRCRKIPIWVKIREKWRALHTKTCKHNSHATL
jgi:hypothetical protein